MNAPRLSDEILNWLIRARSHLQLGRVAVNTPGILAEDACFHAQQCAEKALKGLLVNRNFPFPRTHAIEVLLDILKANGIPIPPSVDGAYELSQYAVQTPYPGIWEPVTLDEARHAWERAAIVLTWVEGQLGENA
jgi:HEPN domain-containing protein